MKTVPAGLSAIFSSSRKKGAGEYPEDRFHPLDGGHAGGLEHGYGERAAEDHDGGKIFAPGRLIPSGRRIYCREEPAEEREDTSGGRMSEKRFTALETMVAYHEDTIQKLNEVIYKQQVMIDKLEEKIDALAWHLQDVGQLRPE
ncbi:MAG: SlyX family protein [Candidatus Moduliflexus flocculans]|nr:SlyX family protein [Candidatus Moduliflexus flocculans]